jgi:hypothetical protein
MYCHFKASGQSPLRKTETTAQGSKLGDYIPGPLYETVWIQILEIEQNRNWLHLVVEIEIPLLLQHQRHYMEYCSWSNWWRLMGSASLVVP